jgi:hypothetical protein
VSDHALWAVIGVLYRLDVALDTRDVRAARRLATVAMRLVLAELDDSRRRRA